MAKEQQFPVWVLRGEAGWLLTSEGRYSGPTVFSTLAAARCVVTSEIVEVCRIENDEALRTLLDACDTDEYFLETEKKWVVWGDDYGPGVPDWDYVVFFVRGFDDQELGEKIVAELEAIGFTVKEQFDVTSDDLGGLIETHPAHETELAENDLHKIRERIVAVEPSAPIWVQFRAMAIVAESDW